MPGICGVINERPTSDELGRQVRAMQDGLAHADWYVRESRCEPRHGLALGSARLGFDGQAAKIAWDDATASGIVLDGELYASRSLADELRQSGAAVRPGDHAALVLAAFLRGGPSFLKKLHGSFAAAIWDGVRCELTLVTDRFGTRPLYYVHDYVHEQVADRPQFAFASGVAALLAADKSRRSVSPRGLAQFFTFGHYLRDDTSLEGVRVLPAAALFTYRPDSGRLRQSTWWSLGTAASASQTDDWLPRLDEAFAAAVRRTTEDTPHLGISLSGGLDARTILGVIDTAKTPLKSVCLGMPGSLDHRASAELAKIAGCPHHAHVLDGGFLGRFREHLERMVQLTDGQYLSQCIVIPTLPVYRRLGIHTLLRGHAGELMHMQKAYNYSLDDEALAIRSAAELRGWLFRRLQAYMLEGVTEPLFAAPYQQGLRELAAQSLDDDLAEVAHVDPPLQRIWHLFVQQRLRRETVLSLLKFRSVVEPRLPYLDADLVPLLLAAPPYRKLGEETQAYILAKRRPEYLRVTNVNTGAPIGAGPLRQRLATLQMKVLAKLGVPGYQPYERLGLWLRRELAPTVREILLDSRTLDRGVFRPAGVQAVVRQHLEEGRNHTFLLMALMVFELGLRRLIDGPLPTSDESSEPARAKLGRPHSQPIAASSAN